MQPFRFPRLLTFCIFMLCAPKAACSAQHYMQPVFAIDSAGIGAGAVYTLRQGNELQIIGTFYGSGASGSGNYTLTDGNGANPVQLNIAYGEHISTGKVGLQFNHFVRPGKPLFVSAGLVRNYFRADAGSIPTNSSIVVSGTSYSAAQLGVLGIHARWNTIAPYLGVGWVHKNTNGSERGPRYEIGAYNLGRAHVTFTPQGVVSANPAIFGGYLSSLQGQLQNSLSGLTIYPILRVSVPVGGSSR